MASYVIPYGTACCARYQGAGSGPAIPARVLTSHTASLGLHPSAAVTLVDYLCAVGRRQRVHFLWRPTLRDPNDDFVLELAVAARCDYIVTHNVADFDDIGRFGVKLVRPGRFLRQLEEAS